MDFGTTIDGAKDSLVGFFTNNSQAIMTVLVICTAAYMVFKIVRAMFYDEYGVPRKYVGGD